MVAGAYAKPCVSDVKLVADAVEDTAYGNEIRHEAAQVDKAGKYEPKLTENGIPADVLAKLLPGDDVVELSEPVVGGSIAYRFVKRAFDVVSCGCALIILAIPMGIIALKIKSESPGPVIYAQRRVGKGGKIFNVYKFRSMYTDAEARGAQWARGDDPRVTPFGKVMRKTRMDEIPQFWNVFRGDMSVVGPRPTTDMSPAHARTASASALRPPRRVGAGKDVFGLGPILQLAGKVGCGGDGGNRGKSDK